MGETYAHSVAGRPPDEWETVAQHEQRTARLCRLFLRRIAAPLAPWADLLGRWHDVGKYQPAFQRKLHSTDPGRVHVEHSALGAALAYRQAGSPGQALAFAIAGHHTGLANAGANDSVEFPEVTRLPLKQRLEEAIPQLDALQPLLPVSLAKLPAPPLPAWIIQARSKDERLRSFAFLTRMLFSVLVDADRLATAEFYAKAEGRTPERRLLHYDKLRVLRDRLDEYVDCLTTAAASAERPSAVNTLRAGVLAACRKAALQPPGLFSLTVPTGGGKTLSAMSFALRHAVASGLDRVIVVIPFTSIIEQNADRYRKALAVDGKPDNRNVLEHHSGIDEQEAEERDQEAELRRRLAAENWDAPIVVTTAVQFFESLFSDHPSRCRKLHRIAKSVIILDEVQTLPPGLLLPILEAMKELTAHYGATVVLSTATPPALAQRSDFPQGLTGVQPIIDDPVRLAASPAARRVRIEWRVERVTPYDELANELAAHRQVLAVVHRRQDARILAEKLPSEGRFHLSALMCPAHRLQKIGEIGRALKENRMCRVVSTQLVEAGVDIDLPVVYRALAGLDSLAQCAGRCDREGRLTAEAGEPAGRFVVFRAETAPPPGVLRKALESTQTLLALAGSSDLPETLDPFNPEHCHLFFQELYGKAELDQKHVLREWGEMNFANVAAAFRMIDDAWSHPVVVPWGEGRQRVAAFREEPCRQTARALQPFIVHVPRQHLDHLLSAGAIERWAESNVHLSTDLFGDRYSKEFGLAVDPDSGIDPDLLMI